MNKQITIIFIGCFILLFISSCQQQDVVKKENEIQNETINNSLEIYDAQNITTAITQVAAGQIITTNIELTIQEEVDAEINKQRKKRQEQQQAEEDGGDTLQEEQQEENNEQQDTTTITEDTTIASTNILLSDNFEDNVLFQNEGSIYNNRWHYVYLGYGRAEISDGKLILEPQAATQPDETHATLVVSENKTWRDYDLSLEAITEQQLRQQTAANPWEVAWILFRYQDPQTFYYFIHKPNGIELGKLHGSTEQHFLFTADTPQLTLNTWSQYEINVEGNHITVAVNGQQVVDYVDNNPITEGGIGFYTEDARIAVRDVKVAQN